MARDHENTSGQQFITSSIHPQGNKFLSTYWVGSRTDSRLCDTWDEADLFRKNGIRSETGSGPLGQRGGLER